MLSPVQHNAHVARSLSNLFAARRLFAAKPEAKSAPTIKVEIVDAGMLPSAFVTVTPNMEAIRGACENWLPGAPVPAVPGLRFEIDEA